MIQNRHSSSASEEEKMSTIDQARMSPIDQARLDLMHRYWNAANYLTIGQISLQENPRLREPLQARHIKPRMLGHWGTSPGLSFIYVHVNRLIQEHDVNAIYLAGPGHGGPALLAKVYLEGTYTEIDPLITLDTEGIHRLFRQKPLIAPSLEAVLLRCLEKEPEKRFQHGSELAQALLVQLEDAAGDEYALSPLSLQKEERETPGCDGDEGLIIAPISSEAQAPAT